MGADPAREVQPWQPVPAEKYVVHVASSTDLFHPDELRLGWVALDGHYRPVTVAPGSGLPGVVTFRLATDAGQRAVDCFVTAPPAGLRDRCEYLHELRSRPDFPPEVVVPRWYDRGVSIDGRWRPVLVHDEQRGPTVEERLPQLRPDEVRDLLARWIQLRDRLGSQCGLWHAAPSPARVFLPGADLAMVRVTGWELPAGTERLPIADPLQAALGQRLGLPPAPIPSPPPGPVPPYPTPPPVPRRDLTTPMPPPALPPPRVDLPAHPAGTKWVVVLMSAVLAVCVLGLIAVWTL